eukprot:scaffold48900_cov60-Phaeocystis_antarctica.AAC.2
MSSGLVRDVRAPRHRANAQLADVHVARAKLDLAELRASRDRGHHEGREEVETSNRTAASSAWQVWQAHGAITT